MFSDGDAAKLSASDTAVCNALARILFTGAGSRPCASPSPVGRSTTAVTTLPFPGITGPPRWRAQQRRFSRQPPTQLTKLPSPQRDTHHYPTPVPGGVVDLAGEAFGPGGALGAAPDLLRGGRGRLPQLPTGAAASKPRSCRRRARRARRIRRPRCRAATAAPASSGARAPNRPTGGNATLAGRFGDGLAPSLGSPVPPPLHGRVGTGSGDQVLTLSSRD